MTHTCRVLRQKTHRARIEHVCNICETSIFPADLYEVTVQLIQNGAYKHLRVRKEHASPCCPYDPSDEEGRDLFPMPLELPMAA